MAIEKLNLTFQDEQGTDFNKYGLIEDGGNEKQVTLRRLANITRAGTPLSAENLNKPIVKINEVIDKVNDKVDNAINADNVTSLENNDTNANANVKFTIGNRSFSKTVNNVANASHANSADNASHATSADSATDANHATSTTNVDSLINNDTGSNDHIKFTIGNKVFEKTINWVDNAADAEDSFKLNGYVRGDNSNKVATFVPYVNSSNILSIGSGISFRRTTSSGTLQLQLSASSEITNGQSKTLLLPAPTAASDSLVLKSYVDSEFTDIKGDIRTINGNISQIESRLDNLGFKSSSAIATGFQSTTANSLRKQGKFVIFNFVGLFNYGSSRIINIPASFRPKQNTNVIMGSSDGNWKEITVYTNGNIDTGAGGIETISFINVGWETT